MDVQHEQFIRFDILDLEQYVEIEMMEVGKEKMFDDVVKRREWDLKFERVVSDNYIKPS
jgi:hypothetical protein